MLLEKISKIVSHIQFTLLQNSASVSGSEFHSVGPEYEKLLVGMRNKQQLRRTDLPNIIMSIKSIIRPSDIFVCGLRFYRDAVFF